MPKELEPSTNERAFVLEALQQNLRLSSRPFDGFRPLSISFGETLGVADISLGKTRVIARVSATITPPYADRPFDGIFQISTELSPLASTAFEVGRQNEQEVLLSRLIEKSLRRSHAIDTESLCIIAGKKCWSVRVDVHFIDHDGGMVDAACIAVVTALLHFKRPDVSVAGEVVTVHTMEERVPVPLSILHIPICVTFSFFLNGEVVLVDADLLEEQLRDGNMTITMNKFGEVCQIAKAGGEPIEARRLMECAHVALVKATEITKLINEALEEDNEKRRRKANLIGEASAANER